MTSLSERIGQLFFCGWQGATPYESRSVSAHGRALVADLQVGGLILMGRNLGAPPEVAALVNEFQELSRTPLWIGVDQEGGAVARFTRPGIAFPGNMALGATGRPVLAAAAARATGEQLLAMGVNVDFAPVLDVNNNPANPIIGTRSFGENPALVSRLGLAALRGYQAAGIVPVAKHFPGHGDTDVDSHLALPVQAAPRERLERVELAPFRASVEARAPAIMTTHILFPALDPALPATLSRRILTDLLREEWGYKGVIITDCLEMQGIAGRWGPQEAAVLALEAGADLLLVCHTWETQQRMAAVVREAIRSGRLSEARIDASVERLLALKRHAGLMDRPPCDPAAAAATVSAARYQAVEREVALAAVTLVNDSRLLPLRADEPVLVAGPAAPAAELARLLRDRYVQQAWVSEEVPAAGCLVLLLDGPGTAAPEAERANRPDAIVIALREPYPLALFPNAGCRLAAYSSRACALTALADILTCRAAAWGTLPVSLV
jgi:beta-N-acetylhexosaminidase